METNNQEDKKEALEPENLIEEKNEQPKPEKSDADELKILQDRHLRLAAEFENYKNRSERERVSSIKFANERILTELLPVLDGLEHAVSATINMPSNPLIVGVDMVLKQFRDILQRFNVDVFSAKGMKFDPAMHEALGELEGNAEKGIVLEEVQKGYTLNGRLVRPARVIVSKGQSAPTE